MLWEDNVGVVGIPRNFVAKSLAMRDDLLAIMDLLDEHDMTLRVCRDKSCKAYIYSPACSGSMGGCSSFCNSES
eukprot:SAG31_NODE_1647_length_7645_cov_47.639544_13_plen_74_part_00